MSVTVNELPGRKYKEGADFSRRYERRFQAITSAKTVGAIAVRDAVKAITGPIGSSYYVSGSEFDLFSWLVDLDISEETSHPDGTYWIATASYGPWEYRNENPTLNPTEVELDFVEFNQVAAYDADGHAIRNSAGDPFTDPPVEREHCRAILTVTKNEYVYSLGFAGTYANTVNDADFTVGDIIFPARTMLAKPIRGTRQFAPLIGWYWRNTYQFHLNLIDTFTAKILDRGFRKASGKLILGPDNHPPTEPALLDGSGNPLAIGGTPVFLEFGIYPERDFSAFSGLF